MAAESWILCHYRLSRSWWIKSWKVLQLFCCPWHSRDPKIHCQGLCLRESTRAHLHASVWWHSQGKEHVRALQGRWLDRNGDWPWEPLAELAEICWNIQWFGHWGSCRVSTRVDEKNLICCTSLLRQCWCSFSNTWRNLAVPRNSVATFKVWPYEMAP